MLLHWIEHLHGDTYLIASDLGLVARINLSSEEVPIMGDRFAHDDMEFLTYNKTSNRAFATSFDRNVYEIDPVSCQSKGIIYQPGYKCVWAKTLEREPSTLIVQSRNGGLFKADVNTGETIAVIKETPDALWTSLVMPNGNLIAAGEEAK